MEKACYREWARGPLSQPWMLTYPIWPPRSQGGNVSPYIDKSRIGCHGDLLFLPSSHGSGLVWGSVTYSTSLNSPYLSEFRCLDRTRTSYSLSRRREYTGTDVDATGSIFQDRAEHLLVRESTLNAADSERCACLCSRKEFWKVGKVCKCTGGGLFQERSRQIW